MKCYDAHVHIHILSADVTACLSYLKNHHIDGFSGLVVIDYPKDVSMIKKMIPGFFHEHITLENLSKDKTIVPIASRSENPAILLYLDARFIDTDVETKIETYFKSGFRGLKLLYVPEEDPVLQIGGMQQAFGRSMQASEKITSLLVENAAKHRMPVLLHIDLRRYGSFAAEMIGMHPEINFNIAHFGFSRRIISEFLDKYENCYSDTSSLTPFMEKDPEKYFDFITHYQDKILFGSDAVISNPHGSYVAKNAMLKLVADENIRQKVFNENYLRFHFSNG